MIPETNPAPGYERHPEHEIKISQFPGSVIVWFDGEQIAHTSRAILVEESNHFPVYYIPFHDVDQRFLVESQHVTRCPFKGKANYWNVKVGFHEIDNAAWSYDLPYDEALELAGMMAFQAKKVTVETAE